MNETTTMNPTYVNLGEKLFRFRDYTPVPLIILLLIVADPTVFTAVVGLILVAFGEFIRIYSVSFIGAISRTRKDSTGDRLIKEGPFSYVRNPLYVGNFFITLGVAFFAGNFKMLLLVMALFCFQYFLIVKYEESLLEQRFGEEYRSYKRQVPAWVPSHPVELEDIVWPESFTPAIKSEKRTLTAIAAVLLLLVLFG